MVAPVRVILMLLRTATQRNLAAVLFLGLPCLYSQTIMLGSGPGGAVRVFTADLAILEVQEARTDVPCAVTPLKPVLGFDLKFHAGYEVRVPLKEVAGSEDLLTMVFRVSPENRPEEATYFLQRVKVPAVQQDAKGDAYLQGFFDLGEGKYHVDWLMRDRAEHYCSSYWDTEAELAPRDKQLSLAVPAGKILASDAQPFKEEPPIERSHDEPPLSVKVLMNFAPPNASAAAMQPMDTSALVSILRGIAREPRIGKFSLIAFNLNEQRVLFRQDNADRIDFPALGEAMNGLNLGTVDLKNLSRKHGETEFLATLIQNELASAEQPPDALIFAGPKAMLEENVSETSLKDVGEIEYPVFYMNYNLDPQTSPWRDAIGKAVRFFKGQEFTISRPRDLWSAMSEMVSRIVKFKSSRRLSSAVYEYRQ